MMRNFAYSGGLSGGLLRHIKNEFFNLFQNEVKSVLNIKESYSMEKKPKKCSKEFASIFIKLDVNFLKHFYGFFSIEYDSMIFKTDFTSL